MTEAAVINVKMVKIWSLIASENEDEGKNLVGIKKENSRLRDCATELELYILLLTIGSAPPPPLPVLICYLIPNKDLVCTVSMRQFK